MTFAGIATHTRRPEMSLTDRDDRRHQLAPTPLARESLIFLLFLPEEHLGCIAYTWVNGEGLAGSMVLVFGAENEQLFKAYVENVPMPKDADFTDWKVGALGVEHGAHHDDCVVTFAKDDFALDYHFKAMTPAFTYHHNADSCPPFLARAIAVDAFGHRDHSWGNRDWGGPTHWKWWNIMGPNETAIHAMELQAFGKTTLHGYVQKNGVIGTLVSLESDITYDDRFMHTLIDATLVDDEGRTTRVQTRQGADLVWPVSDFLTLHEASMFATIDGAPGVGYLEMAWPPAYAAHHGKAKAKVPANASGLTIDKA